MEALADNGKAITNGSIVTICIDVPSAEIVNWSDCDLSAADDEISDTDALKIITEGNV